MILLFKKRELKLMGMMKKIRLLNPILGLLSSDLAIDFRAARWYAIKSHKRDIRKHGIIGDKTGKYLFPKDGLIFLKALRFEYSGSIMRASEVKEG